jgi:pyridoxine/pyridoxamine 5'-phosphate oxidase
MFITIILIVVLLLIIIFCFYIYFYYNKSVKSCESLAVLVNLKNNLPNSRVINPIVIDDNFYFYTHSSSEINEDLKINKCVNLIFIIRDELLTKQFSIYGIAEKIKEVDELFFYKINIIIRKKNIITKLNSSEITSCEINGKKKEIVINDESIIKFKNEILSV